MLYFDIEDRDQVNKRVVNLLPIEKTARPTGEERVFEVTLSVEGTRQISYPAPLYLVFVPGRGGGRLDKAWQSALGSLEGLWSAAHAGVEKYLMLVEGNDIEAARKLLDAAPTGAHKAILFAASDDDDAEQTIRQARAARDAGMVVQAVYAGENMPDYLHEADSAHSAYHLPRYESAALGLAILLQEFSEAVLQARHNIMLTDYIVRRSTGDEPVNDGTFTLDEHSLAVAYQQHPGEQPQFTPVDFTSARAALTQQENFTVLNFSVGRLWAPELAAARLGRVWRVLLRYRLRVNPGVHSGDWAQPLPTNFTATVDWTELGQPLLQLFPVPAVYVPPVCACAQALSCPCYACRRCYPCHPCQPCWAACHDTERPLNWGGCKLIK